MEFEQYSAVLLVTSPDAPALSDEEAAALQDAHLAYLAPLHVGGYLLAVGPLGDPDGELRGLSILNVGPERARELKEADPAVRAGVYRLRVLPWRVPAGLVHFTPGFVPRSLADVIGTNSAPG
jgi:uncharacterized protein YciI